MSIHTFIILGYKESPYLEECIKSLKAQTCPSKIILTTSTPNLHLHSLVTKYDIPYFINEEGDTIGADWNFALAQADTPLVTLAHQDDIYLPSFSHEILHSFGQTENNQTQIIFTDYDDLVNGKIRKGSKNAFIKKILLTPFFLNKSIASRWIKKLSLSFGDPICCPSVTLHKGKLAQFRFNETFACAIDWEAWYRLAQQKGRFSYINKKLMVHRIHLGSETSTQLISGRRWQEEKILFEQIWGKTGCKILSYLYKFGHKDNIS